MIEKSESVDQGLHGNLSAIMNDNVSEIHKTFPEGSFARVFWDQQLENSKKGDAPSIQMASTNDQVVFKFEAYVKRCLSCHEVEWFHNTTIRMDSQGLYPLHQEFTRLPTGYCRHNEA